MKRIVQLIIIYILGFTAVYAQPHPDYLFPTRQKKLTARHKERMRLVYTESTPFFENLEADPKWNNESMIVLSRWVQIETKGGFESEVDHAERNLYVLQDQKAVEQFTSFYYSMPVKHEIILNVIKKSGEVIPVDMSQSIADEKVGRNYVDRIFEYNNKYRRKIAIEGLEIGDKIDYYYHYQLYYEFAWQPISVPIQLVRLQRSFPIQKTAIRLKLAQGYNFNYATIGPKLDFKFIDEVEKIQIFEAGMPELAGLKNEDANSDIQLIPELRYRIGLTMNIPLIDDFWLAEKRVNGQVDLAQIQHIISKNYKNTLSNVKYKRGGYIYTRYSIAPKKVYPEYVKWAMRQQKRGKKPEEIIDLLYIKLRYDTYFGKYASYGQFMNDEFSAVVMLEILKKLKIPADLIVMPYDRKHDLLNIISRNELFWLVRYKSSTGYRFIHPITKYTRANTAIPQLYNQQGFVVNLGERPKKGFKIDYSKQLIDLGNDAPTNNINKEEYVLNIDENDVLVQVKESYAGVGWSILDKAIFDVSNLASEDKDFLMNEGERVFVKTEDIASNLKNVESKVFQQLEIERRINEALKKVIEEKISLSELKSRGLSKTGRLPENNEVIFEYSFKTEDLVTQVANKRVINLRKLLGNYEKIDSSSVDSLPIILFYPYTNLVTFRIIIPDAYQLEGLDQMNVLFENNIGRVEMNATLANGELLLHLTRELKDRDIDVNEIGQFANYANTYSELANRPLVLGRKVN